MELELYGLAWALLWLAGGLFQLGRGRWLFPAVGIGLLAVFRDIAPAYRLVASSLFFLYAIKAAVLGSFPSLRLGRLDRLLYMTAWPGLDPDRLSQRAEPSPETGRRFAAGLTLALCGAAAIGALALWEPLIPRPILGWAGIAALLLLIHFGVSDVLTSLTWLSGRPIRPLFDLPFRSATLSDFWTRRWNRPYVDMNRVLFLPVLSSRMRLRWAVLGVFVVSGLLHEMAISYPAGGGWGGPLLYFVLQGVGVLGERSLRRPSRVLAWLWILVPIPLLFHSPFRETLIVPLFVWLHALLVSRPLGWYVDILLWVLPAMQLSVLMASYQVPRRLNWHEELARLSPFNRKLMWTYAFFIVSSVIGFGILTIALHGAFMRGETAAIGVACFMSCFWVLRLLFDTFYYSSDDWPAGEIFKVGHALLNALFVFLVLGYGSVAVWGLLRGMPH